jgi:hypothetical protein
MSTPLASIFHGDITLEQGSDVTQFGWGDININRRCIINGNENSTCNTDGSLIVAGGVGISKTANIHENLNVLYGVTRLTETHIDTNNGLFSVTGGNKITMKVGPESEFVSIDGNLNLSSLSQSLQLYGGLNSDKAVDIQATHNAGGITLLSGINTGHISLISGSGGITETTSNGNINITANNGSGNFTVNSDQANQNLTLKLDGATDSSLKILSSGTNITNKALIINTTNQDGSIQISNANGLGDGSIEQLVGSGGFNMITNTYGSISIKSQAAGSSYLVDTSNTNQHLIIGVNNPNDSSLILKSEGTNVTNDAIQIYTVNQNGNISISQPALSTGKVDIITGEGGFITTTRAGGSIVMTTNSATSTYTNSTTDDNQDLNITVTGNTNSKVNISSSGTGPNAINLSTSNPAGGIYLDSSGKVQIESQDVINGVQISTNTSNIPVYIGTPNSTCTIYGNLDVKGTTTSVESTVVTINDNIIVVNNAPSGTANGGIAVKRYQSANDSSYGDVVADTPDESGTVQNGSNTLTTVHLDITANNTNDYYAGWWIKVTDGQGKDQVRRIKSYIGSTKVATIYSTADQTGVLGNPTPVEGLDFSTILDNTSTYSLYPCEFVMMIWDEAVNEFSLTCSPSNNPSSAVHYSDLHINNLVANGITTNTINGSLADITFIVTLNNNSSSPVSMPNFPTNYGIYMVYIKPLSETSRTHGIFMIGRVDALNMPGTVIRLISVKGVYNDQLDIQWPANDYPQLLYRPYPNGIGGSTQFKVKIVTL